MDAKDRRTKRQKLQDMANQSASPEEAKIAQQKLDALPPENPFEGLNAVLYNMTFSYRPSGSGTRQPFYEEPDPGIGVYDFVNMRWSFTKKD